MCGIAGLAQVAGAAGAPIDPRAIQRMCRVARHRGPDDAGYVLFSAGSRAGDNHWLELTDEEFRHRNVHIAPIESDYAARELAANPWHVALGHRRLSIIDLTPRGHQPMADRTRGVWLTYNGEVYNFRELRAELEGLGYTFQSTSDTEVLLYAYRAWGDAFVSRLNGMFAFALWDNARNKLVLARDRYGVKPLYYWYDNGRLAFASEVKSLLEAGLRVEVDEPALGEYFTFQNTFSDRTLFRGVRILPPGSTLTVEIGAGVPSEVRPRRYWRPAFHRSEWALDEAQTADRLYELFVQAVQRQLVSDVPVGSYLSGGMDSGSITSVARKHFGRICTFTLGFDMTSASGLELAFDERRASEALSNHFKTEHYEALIHAGDMEAVMPELIWHLEDLRVGQCYPNYYVARLAGKFCKVVLSGTGGDELFAGYPWRYYRSASAANPAEFLRRYYDFWQRLVPEEDRPRLFRPETHAKMRDHAPFDVFSSVLADDFADSPAPRTPEDYINLSLTFEMRTFLHGLFIVDDKVSMAHSLETRVPFLDDDLVNFALAMPVSLKLSNLEAALRVDENQAGKRIAALDRTNDGKNILRKSMARLIPRDVVERAKQGFSAPDASWFRGESIEYVKATLLDPRARIYDYLATDFVGTRIGEHTSGQKNNRLLIWSLLSFEHWLRQFRDRPAAPAAFLAG